MSAKIHNGYLVPAGVDPFTLIDPMRTAVDNVGEHLQLDQIADRASELIDRARLAQIADQIAGLRAHPVEPDTYSPLVRATTDVWMRAGDAAKTNQRSRYDLEVHVTFIAHPELTGRHLALVYTEHAAIRNAVAVAAGLDPYPYWNNTDRPDDVNETEWSTRARVWDAAVGYDTPASRGLSWAYTPLPIRANSADVAVHLPDVSRRARNVAVHFADLSDLGDNWTPSEVMDAVAELVPRVETLLEPITVADLDTEPEGTAS